MIEIKIRDMFDYWDDALSMYVDSYIIPEIEEEWGPDVLIKIDFDDILTKSCEYFYTWFSYGDPFKVQEFKSLAKPHVYVKNGQMILALSCGATELAAWFQGWCTFPGSSDVTHLAKLVGKILLALRDELECDAEDIVAGMAEILSDHVESKYTMVSSVERA